MMNQVWAFLNKYNRREQLLILGLAAILVVFIFWAAIISPLNKKRDLLVRQNAATSESLGQVQMMTAQIQQLQNQGAQAQSGENISSVIDTSLRNNGLKMDGFQPGPSGDVRVRLEMARYDALMQWLYELEYKHGISILEISLAETRDIGIVTVNLRLQKI
jgi:general secretion pathway protein M